MNRRILIIDDQETILEDFRTILCPSRKRGHEEMLRAIEALKQLGVPVEKEEEQEEDYHLTTVLQGHAGCEMVREANAGGKPFAVAFIDIRMPPGWDGIKTASEIRKIDRDIEIVLVTAYSDRDRKEIVTNVGSPEKLLYLKKPFDAEEIRQLALCLTQKWELQRKEKNHRKRLERLLQKITTIKTHTGDSQRLLQLVLEDAVEELQAHKGLVISVTGDRIKVEACTGRFEDGELNALIRQLSEMDLDAANIFTVEQYTILPLKTDLMEVIIVFGDCIAIDDRPLIELFLSSTSELINNARLFEKWLKTEKMASIGLATRTILHDLRTPLMLVSSSLELCLMGQDISPQLERRIAIASEGARRIHQMVTDISDFAQGGVQLQLFPVRLASFIDEVLALWSGQLRQNGIGVSLEVDETMEVIIDRSRFHRVFDNLIANAVEAMEKSERRELAMSAQAPAQGKGIVLKISDTGQGIPRALQPKIFDPFISYGKRQGSGLGLAIVKHFVELHGGEIMVETGEGGTTFVITLRSLRNRQIPSPR